MTPKERKCRVCNGTGYASTIPMDGRVCDECRGSGTQAALRSPVEGVGELIERLRLAKNTLDMARAQAPGTRASLHLTRARQIGETVAEAADALEAYAGLRDAR